MKIGYPCINLSFDCRSSRTFRFKNYSKERLISTVKGNLECLQKILQYNLEKDIKFFRITSDLVPFASHKVMNTDWQEIFQSQFNEIGKYIKKNNMRITMHPGQYTVLNSTREGVFRRSLKEIKYHVEVLDLMGLDATAKVQVHVGGVYNDKEKSKARFIQRYNNYKQKIKDRLVIENDDKSYNLADCLEIYQKTDIPIIFDIYHHTCNKSGESIKEGFKKFTKTWNRKDGLPIIHYSDEHPIKGKPSHSEHIKMSNFKKFIIETKDFNFDIMLEIKDKETSALEAIKYLRNDSRFNTD